MCALRLCNHSISCCSLYIQFEKVLLNLARGDTSELDGAAESAKYLEVPEGVTLLRGDVLATRDGVLGVLWVGFCLLESFAELAGGLAAFFGGSDFLLGEKYESRLFRCMLHLLALSARKTKTSTNTRQKTF